LYLKGGTPRQGWVKRGVPERPRDTCDPQGSGGGGAAIRLTRRKPIGTGFGFTVHLIAYASCQSIYRTD